MHAGEFWGTWLLVPFQVTLFVGLPITYAVTGGQSLHKVRVTSANQINGCRAEASQTGWWLVQVYTS